MTVRHFILALSAVAALAACQPAQEKTETPPAPEASRAITDPAAVVRQLYDRYATAGEQTPPLSDAPWTARMAADIAAMNARTAQGDAPPLDFDPIVDAQDYQISNVTTSADSIVEASHAVVRARFTNIGEQREVIYDMLWEDDRWKIDNIRTSEWDMRTIVMRTE